MQEIKRVKNITFSVVTRNTLTDLDSFEYKTKDFLEGKLHIEVLRPNATKVLGKDTDLKQDVEINISTLPDDIRQDLINIFKRIEKLL